MVSSGVVMCISGRESLAVVRESRTPERGQQFTRYRVVMIRRHGDVMRTTHPCGA
jgi:hypothetical protein